MPWRGYCIVLFIVRTLSCEWVGDCVPLKGELDRGHSTLTKVGSVISRSEKGLNDVDPSEI